MGNPFDKIPKSMLPIIAGLCEHGGTEGDKRACPKCAITSEINRLITAGLTPEKLFHVMARVVAELIGQSAGGEAKHRVLVDSFTNLLRLTVKVVEGEQLSGRADG